MRAGLCDRGGGVTINHRGSPEAGPPSLSGSSSTTFHHWLCKRKATSSARLRARVFEGENRIFLPRTNCKYFLPQLPSMMERLRMNTLIPWAWAAASVLLPRVGRESTLSEGKLWGRKWHLASWDPTGASWGQELLWRHGRQVPPSPLTFHKISWKADWSDKLDQRYSLGTSATSQRLRDAS